MTGRVDARQFPYLNEMPRADIGWTEVGELISAAARSPSRRSAAAFLWHLRATCKREHRDQEHYTPDFFQHCYSSSA